MNKLDLGARIKRFRLERDMSQAEASVHFEVSYSTISRLESGRYNHTGKLSDLVRAKIERKLEEVPQ